MHALRQARDGETVLVRRSINTRVTCFNGCCLPAGFRNDHRKRYTWRLQHLRVCLPARDTTTTEDTFEVNTTTILSTSSRYSDHAILWGWNMENRETGGAPTWKLKITRNGGPSLLPPPSPSTSSLPPGLPSPAWPPDLAVSSVIFDAHRPLVAMWSTRPLDAHASSVTFSAGTSWGRSALANVNDSA